ncbi:glucose-methanol-choline oxidoreductase [Photobacterium leiognathi subsp. mandapamensis]|nr:glucose-methanol-choline oxidoreductase [Photobacterium leiognathi subsp. mandapamensis]
MNIYRYPTFLRHFLMFIFFFFPLLASATNYTESYDYIVVGAGAGGGPLASSLAERGFTVLLVEAGDLREEDKDLMDAPVLHVKASEHPRLSWQYFVNHYSDPNRNRADSKHCPQKAGCPQDAEGIFYPRGSTIGGSTAVNAMISVIPHNSDWNNIAAITGDDSWSANNMRHYLTKVERNLYGKNEHQGHGTQGWLPINHNALLAPHANGGLYSPLSPIVKFSYLGIIAGAGIQADRGSPDHPSLFFPFKNINKLRDGREPEGLYQVPVAVNERGRRGGVAGRILNTIDAGYPLTLKTNTLATKVIMVHQPGLTPQAEGIEVLHGAHLYKADRNSGNSIIPAPTYYRANKEVILSAGAFNTPQLLMLSGIGDRNELARHNIPVTVNLPGVGKNLQDRYEVPLVFEKRLRFWIFDFGPLNFPALRNCNYNPDHKDHCHYNWEHHQKGVYTQPGALISMVTKSQRYDIHGNKIAINNAIEQLDPDLYMFALGGTFKGYYPGYSNHTFDPDNQYTWLILKGHSNNRGTVSLRSADPLDTPIINFKYFGDPQAGVLPSNQHYEDLKAIMKGVQLLRRTAQHSTNLTFGKVYHKEVWPGRHVDTHREIQNFIMNESWGHHASCTAKIGSASDPMAVLDSNFKVHGTERLRVVDASVFPKIPGFFPAVAIYMLSEKAADVITEDSLNY